jgi:hypothetical protein
LIGFFFGVVGGSLIGIWGFVQFELNLVELKSLDSKHYDKNIILHEEFDKRGNSRFLFHFILLDNGGNNV